MFLLPCAKLFKVQIDFFAKNNYTINMLIKRCEIDGITVDIKVEDGTSTKEEHTLAFIKLLKFFIINSLKLKISN